MTHWLSDAESWASDSECELIVTSPGAAGTERSYSPESISSVSEFRRLLPDSPVPEFMRILSSYFMDGSPCDRSSSPVSLSSDSEFVALPIDCWIDDSPRPLSPETAESEEDLGFCCEEEEEEWMQQVSEAGSISTLRTRVEDEEDESFAVETSPAQEEKILFVSSEEVKRKTVSQWVRKRA